MNVSVSSITKRFTLRGTPAVFDASFTAGSGSITTLLGPSGSGKTTLLRIVAGLEAVDAGRVLFDARDVTNLPVRERNVGFVFQAFALFNHMTVRNNIAFALDVRCAAQTEKGRRVDELLELVQLDGYGNRYPRQLSGGQRQRVGFARALACRPEILLLDEPFAALDTRVRMELRDWLVRLHETTRLTTILVTHDQEEALELSQQIVVMDQGRVVQAGAPSEIYDRPSTPFVASFVGTANVLRCRVEGQKATIGRLTVSELSGVPDGTMVQAIVRPHDVGLAKQASGAHGSSLGRIVRAVGLGPYIKLHLCLPSMESVTVQMPRKEAELENWAVGDTVAVDFSGAKFFVGDQAL